MSKVVIFGPEISPFVVKVLAAASYKGIDYEHQANLSVSDVYKVSPITGRIPVVSFDDEMVYDSTFILRRFDDLKPERPLLSKDSNIAARQRMLEDWSDESLYWHIMALRWIKENAHRSVEQNAKFLPVILRPFAGFIFRNFIGNRTRGQGLGRLPYDILVSELGERLDDLVEMLSNQPYFFGEEPCAADFAIFGQFNTGIEEGVTPDFAREVGNRLPLMEWRRRMKDVVA
ncbi:MAG: glutathione S-transferase family protein [Pseudomonadales bacterium]|nr:glutathione S-transferase family protein [Pseudomonadales bacterium]